MGDLSGRSWERAAEQRLELLKLGTGSFRWQLFDDEMAVARPELQDAVARLLLKHYQSADYSPLDGRGLAPFFFGIDSWEIEHSLFEDVLMSMLANAASREGLGRGQSERIVKRLEHSEPQRRQEILVAMIECALRNPYWASPPALTTIVKAVGTRHAHVAWQRPLIAAESIEAIVEHVGRYSGVKPSRKWWKQLELIATEGERAAYCRAVDEALDVLAGEAGAVPSVFSEYLRGMMVVLALWPGEETVRILGRGLRVCGEKLPGLGPRCEKGFGGAVWALGEMGTFEALAVMSLARGKVKVPKLQKVLEGALTAAAGRQGLSLEELEERVVPDFGLGAEGVLVEGLSGGAGELSLDERGRARLVWRSGAKVVSAPTAAMKAGSADVVAGLKRAKKDLEAAVGAQKRRLDGMFVGRRRIPYGEWVERYLEHPVMRVLTKRLVWDFRRVDDTVLAMPRDWEVGGGRGFVGVDGGPVEVGGEGTTVKLWHPMESTREEALAWRDAVFSWEVTQPVKQVFREVYVLTPAEEATRVYSNRYAAQIIRQHQAVALMRERGWKASFAGLIDSKPGYPSRRLEEWGLTAEFFVEMAGDDTTDVGIAVYLATDQVRFLREGEAVALADIPDIVLSEVFRDVDLFVGVSGVGNDPEWRDQGEREVFTRDYWHDTSFGELSAMAETRKDVLARLLPRLKVGQVSRIEGRFLMVKGTRHTYKIHLGSGNILMSPGDRYLCIVPSGRDDVESLYLPFEGDRTLAVILSKATLLASDDKITDQTILAQL